MDPGVFLPKEEEAGVVRLILENAVIRCSRRAVQNDGFFVVRNSPRLSPTRRTASLPC